MSKVVLQNSDRPFSASDLERITRTTFVEAVEYHDQIVSTNDRVLAAVDKPEALPWLVLADAQTGGRGRGTNRWWSGPGALTFSLLIDTQAVSLPTRRLPQASLTLGLAVCETMEDLLKDRACDVRLKWPNDVVVDERKICGILIELPPDRPESMVVGIGVNVNNSARDAPSDIQDTAIALCDAAGHPFRLVDVLEQMLIRIATNLEWIGCQQGPLRSRWQDRCLLTQRQLRVDFGERVVQGLCLGIGDDGALLVETPTGIERCYAGQVTYE